MDLATTIKNRQFVFFMVSQDRSGNRYSYTHYDLNEPSAVIKLAIISLEYCTASLCSYSHPLTWSF